MNRQETREDQARREVGQTDISPTVAKLITAVFLLIIFGCPFAHRVTDKGNELSIEKAGPTEHCAGLVNRVFDANAALLERISLYQAHLDDDFILSRELRTPVQAIMLRLGVGNEKVFVGRKGALFYAPGIHYLTGPGFLSPRQLKRRAHAGNELSSAPQPDPVKAIVHFRDQLRQRGIELIVVPAPTKATVHPGLFFHDAAQRLNPPLQNVTYEAFLERLEEMRINLFDPAPMLVAQQGQSGRGYLKTDSHWGPEALLLVAESLADHVHNLMIHAEPGSVAYTRHPTRVTNMGDLAFMLDETEAFIMPGPVDIALVREPGGDPWRNRSDADVLLLGDSFANIYSLADMGWGEHAGLAEQLSHALQRPVERIARNDAGAYATREILAKDLARGRDRLAGKKLVIWQFAARELSFGDWKLIDLPEAGEAQAAEPLSASRITGRIAQRSERPVKNAAYKDFVMKLYLTDIQGEGAPAGEADGVVHMLAMRNREFLPPARLRVGTRVTLSLRPWNEVEERYGSLKMGSLDDIMLEIEKPLYWGELK